MGSPQERDVRDLCRLHIRLMRKQSEPLERGLALRRVASVWLALARNFCPVFGKIRQQHRLNGFAGLDFIKLFHQPHRPLLCARFLDDGIQLCLGSGPRTLKPSVPFIAKRARSGRRPGNFNEQVEADEASIDFIAAIPIQRNLVSSDSACCRSPSCSSW